MKLTIFISPWQCGLFNGSTSHTFLMHSRQVRRDFTGFVPGNIYNLDIFIGCFYFFLFKLLLFSVSPHPVWVPSHIPNHLKARIGDMLCYCCYKFFGGAYWKIHFILTMCHLRTTSCHTGIFIVINLTGGKWTTDNILGQIGYSGFVVSGNTYWIVHTETRCVTPFHDHGYKVIIDQPLLFQHGHDFCPE